MFSPADSTQIAVGGEIGAREIDVRYPNGYRNKMHALYYFLNLSISNLKFWFDPFLGLLQSTVHRTAQEQCNKTLREPDL